MNEAKTTHKMAKSIRLLQQNLKINAHY